MADLLFWILVGLGAALVSGMGLAAFRLARLLDEIRQELRLVAGILRDINIDFSQVTGRLDEIASTVLSGYLRELRRHTEAVKGHLAQQAQAEDRRGSPEDERDSPASGAAGLPSPPRGDHGDRIDRRVRERRLV